MSGKPTAEKGIARRRVLALGAALVAGRRRKARAAAPAPITLLTAPLEVGGEWGGSAPADAATVIERVRAVSLAGIGLVGEVQPRHLKVDNHLSGPPFVWLHPERPDTAWVGVDIDARDWAKLAYQFGHELGHVLANSWRMGDNPRPPCQWLEEAIVEAFSIRGLALLTQSWGRDPPFPGNASYASNLRRYRINTMEGYRRPGDPLPGEPLAAWFRASRETLDRLNGLNQAEGAMILTLAAAYMRDAALIADINALNLWPERTAAPIEDYLRLWRKSCAELHAPDRLPALVAARLGIALGPA